MNERVNLCLALHNHQPVGNFDYVFEQAYQDAYLPFLNVFEQYPSLRMSLHTSGSLIEWLDAHHGEYLDRLAALVAAGRLEIIGGAFYEPILTMIPPHDRVGQIKRYTQWLESRLGADIRGMWIPERVWEQILTSDLAAAQIEYTILDDFHFKNAGLSTEQLHGYYVTENNGDVVRVFPGSERLRYLIPFADPHESIEYLRQIAQQHPDAVMVFGDDGEKFGSWPETKKHVYDDGWLKRFFDALVENQSWINTTTLSAAIDQQAPVGKIFLPEGSYREMTEWSLPVARQHEYESLAREMKGDPRWETLRKFVRGGYWRNFKVKYPETDEMYCRMMQVSRRIQQADSATVDHELLDAAQRELYRAQCNCSYWHGAFGGTYLPHLRNAVFNHLIAADNLMDQATRRGNAWVEGSAADFNFDTRPEVLLANDRLLCLLAPSIGGHLYELDVRSICHNLQATLARREEVYHRLVQLGHNAEGGEVASIHDRVIFKQEGLDQRLQYDQFPRKSLMDHFYAEDVSPEAVALGQAPELGDFLGGTYEARLRRGPERVQVQLTREGRVGDHPLRLTKGITLEAGSSTLEIIYLLENLPQDRTLHFGIEFNLAGMPSGADDRYFFRGEERLGQLGDRLVLNDVHDLGLTDEWLGMSVQLRADQPTHFWTFPVETVSQSEGGFELVHQSVAVLPHWYIRGDQDGRWQMTMRLHMDTSLAESRMQQNAPVAEERPLHV